MLLLICIVIFSTFGKNIEIDFDIDTCDDNCPNAIYVFGTDKKFKKITPGAMCHYDDNSCYEVIFDIFSRYYTLNYKINMLQ